MVGEHPVEDLQLLLDGRLEPSRAAQVEAHIVGCARCRRELEAVRRVKSTLREQLPQVAVPDRVAALVHATTRGRGAGVRRRATLVGVGLALAASVAVAIVWTRAGRLDAVRAAGADFVDYRSGELVLQRQTAVPAELEQFFRQQQMPFSTRVFDFGMMAYQLAGGSVHRVSGRITALFAYRGASGERLMCRMYQGTTSDLPSTGDVREYDGITFLVYRVEDATLVFWQEGPVVCVLVVDGDPEQAIALARAKAVRV